MLNEVLIQLYEQGLEKLKLEIEQYKDEADLWKTSGEIPNSGGNLCLHLLGNLNHFFGAVLGGTDYKRNRDSEFTNKNVSKEQLLSGIDATIPIVTATIEKLTPEDLEKQYPIDVFGRAMSTEFFVTHLIGHLNYHLGQINYHRRMSATDPNGSR